MNRILVTKNSDILVYSGITKDQVYNPNDLDTFIRSELSRKMSFSQVNQFTSLSELTSDYYFNKGLDVRLLWSESEVTESGQYALVTYPEAVNSFQKCLLSKLDNKLDTLKLYNKLLDYRFLNDKNLKLQLDDLYGDALNLGMKLDTLESIKKYLGNYGIEIKILKYE
jgi:hypothetical protein